MVRTEVNETGAFLVPFVSLLNLNKIFVFVNRKLLHLRNDNNLIKGFQISYLTEQIYNFFPGIFLPPRKTVYC